MRHVLAPAALVALTLSLACGSSKLTRREAEKDIRQDYPVMVTATVPPRASAIKGSPEHAKLVAIQEALKTQPFTVGRTPEGDREAFTFTLNPGAPATIQQTAKGFEVPAAQAEFVHITRLEPAREGARVTYQIRLARPTPFFPVFQAQNLKAHVGATQDRHATYVKEGRKWILNGTDERYRKVGR